MTEFILNGKRVVADAHPLSRLIDVLRDLCDDTSVKEGCGEGECGACSILVNDRIVNSCLIPVGQIEGTRVTTMSGLAKTQQGRAIIDAFADEGAVQCGFCIPGMVMAAHGLLCGNPHPTEMEVREGISGNLCRCTGYDLIVQAIITASREGRGLW